jgi:hypothetical protein
MASSSRFASSTRKLEDPPSDGGQAVNALRVFYRLTKLETALTYLIERVAALEGTARAAEGARGNGAAAGRASR